VGRRTRWALALLPAVAGLGCWAAARTGLLPDERLLVSASALRGDWLLALGIAVSLLACAALALRERRDADWRRRMDEQAARSARERRLLLSRLDHELKNPLTAMRAAVANVAALSADGGAAGPDAEGPRTAGLRSIEEQVLRLSRLTADLRKIAEVEASPVDERPVDVPELLEEAVDVLREQPGAAGREVSLDLPRAPWPLPLVLGDWDLLALAFGNLLDNAAKYTPPGGRIEVRARESGGQVLVEVADTGPGIPPEDLPQIWEELYRSPQARSVPGSGLGLPLVRAVVERHGGTVTAESRVGRGTVVRVTLPAAASGDSRSEVPPEEARSPAGPGAQAAR
jgi:two-component system, OmpR family, sensor kinase